MNSDGNGQSKAADSQQPNAKLKEVFEYTDASGSTKYIAIEPLRRWAKSKLSPTLIQLDILKVEEILSSKRVSEDFAEKMEFGGDLKPILIALDFELGFSEIIDGNHTYVSLAVAQSVFRARGFPAPDTVPAYCVPRNDWTRFQISRTKES